MMTPAPRARIAPGGVTYIYIIIYIYTVYLPTCVLSQPLVNSTRLAGCLKAPLSTTLVAQPMRWAVYLVENTTEMGGYESGYGTTKYAVEIYL